MRKAQLQSEPGNQNSLMPDCSLTKEQKGILTYGHLGANPSSGSEQTNVVVTARPGGSLLLSVFISN